MEEVKEILEFIKNEMISLNEKNDHVSAKLDILLGKIESSTIKEKTKKNGVKKDGNRGPNIRTFFLNEYKKDPTHFDNMITCKSIEGEEISFGEWKEDHVEEKGNTATNLYKSFTQDMKGQLSSIKDTSINNEEIKNPPKKKERKKEKKKKTKTESKKKVEKNEITLSSSEDIGSSDDDIAD